MNELFDIAAWREILVHAFAELGANVAGFLPNFVGAIIILLLGWAISKTVQVLSARMLRTIGLEGLSNRLDISDFLERAGLRLTFSDIVAKLLFWLVMLTFLLSSVETLGLSAVTETIDRLISFIPSVIGAALIGVGGLLLGRLSGTLMSSAVAAAGFSGAPRLGFLAQIVVVGLVLVLAFEQLGIATNILVLPFTVALAGTVFSIGLAFALGARQVISHIMAGHFLKQTLPRNTAVVIEGKRGLVERVGAVDTLISSAGGSWTIPNNQLIELVVVHPDATKKDRESGGHRE